MEEAGCVRSNEYTGRQRQPVSGSLSNLVIISKCAERYDPSLACQLRKPSIDSTKAEAQTTLSTTLRKLVFPKVRSRPAKKISVKAIKPPAQNCSDCDPPRYINVKILTHSLTIPFVYLLPLIYIKLNFLKRFTLFYTHNFATVEPQTTKMFRRNLLNNFVSIINVVNDVKTVILIVNILLKLISINYRPVS